MCILRPQMSRQELSKSCLEIHLHEKNKVRSLTDPSHLSCLGKFCRANIATIGKLEKECIGTLDSTATLCLHLKHLPSAPGLINLTLYLCRNVPNKKCVLLAQPFCHVRLSVQNIHLPFVIYEIQQGNRVDPDC